MCQSVQQGGGQLLVAEDLDPFPEVQVRRDDQAGFLVELANEVKQQGATGFRKGHVAQFIQDNRIYLTQTSCHLAGVPCRLFLDK